MRVLVLDLVHGGDVLSRAYADRGDEVTAVDVYGTSGKDIRVDLKARGIRVMDMSPAEVFDLGIAPIHCPDHFFGEAQCGRRLTHHQAVEELARFPFPIVEVTGTHGKTSTCRLLSRILAGRYQKVLLLTSGGLEMVEDGKADVLRKKVSIAPPTVLDVSLLGHEAGIGVFEVSLGGTGADVSVITTIGDDYAIAGGTRRAFDGKVQMVRSARGPVIFPEDERPIWEPHVPASRAVTFGSGGDVQMNVGPLSLGRPAHMDLIIGDDVTRVELQAGYLVPAYLTAFGAATAAAWSMGSSIKDISDVLRSFEGVGGRGEIHMEYGRALVRDRNPGVSAASIDWDLKSLEAYGCRDVGLVLEPVSRKVCQALDLAAVGSIVDHHPAVTGTYIMSPDGEGHEKFTVIDSLREARDRHEVVLWCTKEGYL